MIQLSEAQIKKAVSDYLQFGANQGKWLFHRLNAGSFVVENPDGSRRRIIGAGKGTADFLVIQPWTMRFQKRSVISPEYHTVRVTYLEIKKLGAKQSQEQIDFEQMVKGLNCRYFVIRDAEELEIILGE